MRALLLAAVAALLAWWGWPQLAPRLPSAPDLASLPTPAQVSEPPVRCRAADGKLSYRQGACAAGERQEALQGGTVNVVAAPPAAPKAASSAPALRQLADPEGTAELQRKRMEALTK